MSDQTNQHQQKSGQRDSSVAAPVALSTVRLARAWGQGQLAASPSESPRLDADLLLRHLLGWSQAALLVNLDEPLTPAVAATFREQIAARQQGLPVAYLTGEREFLGLSLHVGPGVLVPRPETEELVVWVAAQIATEAAWQAGAIVDVGTGSGAIPFGLATLLPPIQVVGIDRSLTALTYARVNRARLGLEGRVSLLCGDLLAPVQQAAVIVANLPYLRTEQWHAGIAHEPALALFAGPDGLDLYRRLLPQSAAILQHPGLLAMEIDPEQAAAMQSLCLAAFPTGTVAVHHDLAGRARFVSVIQR